ncbi:MAG: btuB 1 [Acidobacteria bacterium]|nr:btuB 1 [Acidobacteriota bacterium]
MAGQARPLVFLPFLAFSLCAAPSAGSGLEPAQGAAVQALGPGAVHGLALDPAGQRVPRARLVLATAVGVVFETEADETGRFTFTNVPPGRYELRGSSPGLAADPLEVEVKPGSGLDLRVSLRLTAVTESVVVSAAQVELPLSRAASSISVISREDMEARQAESIADALRSVPGLSVARNGGRGSVTSVFPRGGESDFTLVLVDGVKVNAFGGGFDFSTLAAEDVERVEVVRGPESALFGSEAIGGTVQVVTRRGGAPQVAATVEGGSLGTSRLSASASGSAGAFSWGGAAGRTASDGYTGVAPATGERVSNDDLRLSDAGGSAGWRAPWGSDLRVTLRWTSHGRGYPGPFGSNPIGAYTEVDRVSRGSTDNRQVGARWQQLLGGGGSPVTLLVMASHADLQNDFVSSYGLSASGTSRSEARAAATIDFSHAAALTLGGAWQGERATSSFIAGDGDALLPVERRDIAGFAEVRLQPHRSFSLTAGARAEHLRRSALPPSEDPYSPRPAFDAHTDTAVNPRIAAAWSLDGGPGSPLSWTRVRAAAGTGMRAPDALEIAFTDNPALRPERSRSIEAGVEQGWAGGRVLVAATAFDNRYDDLIVSVGPVLQDASRYRTDNISNARAFGVETSVAVRTGWGLDLRAGYTRLSTEILAVDQLGVAPPPFAPGDPLLRRPRDEGSLDVLFTRGRLDAFARVGARGRVLDVEPSWGSYGGLFWNDGYAVVDAGASFQVRRSLRVLARVGNLLDRWYEESYGFPAPGRTATIGVRLAAGR